MSCYTEIKFVSANISLWESQILKSIATSKLLCHSGFSRILRNTVDVGNTISAKHFPGTNPPITMITYITLHYYNEACKVCKEREREISKIIHKKTSDLRILSII